MEQVYNGVVYEQEKDFCLVRERDQKRHFALESNPARTQKTGLMQQQTVVTLSMSNEYMDPWNSYLSFSVAAAGNSMQGQVLSGGWLSLVQNVVLMDRNGKEIERCDFMNRLNTTMPRSVFGDAYMDQAGMSEPLDRPIPASRFGKANGAGVHVDMTEPINVLIPLPFLLGLFRTAQLLPPHLLDGMQVWIYWAGCFEAFTQVLVVDSPCTYPAGTGVSTDNIPDNGLMPYYEVSNVLITTDNYLLEHDLHNLVSEEYESKGLPLKFISWGHDSTALTTRNLTANTHYNHNIKKAYTQATRIITHARVFPSPVVSGVHPAGEDFQTHILPNLGMLYNSVTSQRFIAPTKDWMQRNGRSFPLYPTDSGNQMIYYWKQATGKMRHYVAPFSSVLVDDWAVGNNGPSFCKTLCRNPNLMPNVATGLPGESSARVSGQRVDGTNPIDMQHTFPAYSNAQVTQTSHNCADVTELKSAASMARRFDYWVEHIRYVVIQPSGNSVLI